MKRKLILVTLCLCVVLSLSLSGVVAQDPSPNMLNVNKANLGSSFTYQGVLRSSSGLITGVCDLQFDLYDSPAGGTQIANSLAKPNVQVMDGLFMAELDFGNAAFNGDARWLGTAVRCPAGNGIYATLTPRQKFDPAPHTLFANVANGSLGDFTVQNTLWVHGPASLGGPGNSTAATLRAPDLYVQSDSSFGRGDGGRALVHSTDDVLVINYENDFSGGTQIGSNTVIMGSLEVYGYNLRLFGPELVINAGSDRGDGGRALVHGTGDTLILNYGQDFSNGILLDSDTRVAKDLTVEGNTIRLLGNDLYLNAGDTRGDGGRALTHDVGDTLTINYEGDFTGGVRINNLRTGKVVEENLMTSAQQNDLSLLEFSHGDILCWDSVLQQLAKCAQAMSPLVVAVADEQGKPIILGAEPVKVSGYVQPGDLLVTSEHSGYAMAWSAINHDDPPMGTVIAKALEPFDGEYGTVKALIMLR